MKISIDDNGIECRGLFSKKTYPWSSLKKVLLSIQGRRIVRDENGVHREPIRTALLSLHGRGSRITISSKDTKVLKEQLTAVITHAIAQSIPIKTEMLAGTLEEWFEYLGLPDQS